MIRNLSLHTTSLRTTEKVDEPDGTDDSSDADAKCFMEDFDDADKASNIDDA